MSRVTETGPDKAAQGKWGVEDLRERPAPTIPPAGAVEWVLATSGTDLGATYTVLDFVLEDFDYDGDTPTFDLNANNNVEIFKDGVYVMYLWETGISKAVNVSTISFIQARRVSGETPKVLGYSPFSTGLEILVPRRIDSSTDAIDASFSPTSPDWVLPMSFGNGTFGAGTAGPCEIEIQCYHEEDGVGVATTFPTMRMWITRLGASYNP